MCAGKCADTRGQRFVFKVLSAIYPWKPDSSYEWEDYKIDIQLKDNGLFAIFSLKDKEEPEVKLFPLGEKTFALKTDTSDMVFVDGGLTLYGIEGKKTE